TSLLDGRSTMPIAVGPTGGIGFGWPYADVGVARAAAAAGIPYTLSTMATASIERIAREAGGRLWFQIYIFRDPKMTAELIGRARQCGYEALMVTAGVAVGGKRQRASYNDYAIRSRFTPRNALVFATRPLGCPDVLRRGMPKLENVAGFAPEAKSTAEIASSVGQYWDADFDWDDLKAMRDKWPGRMLVKGILRADEAERLAPIGVDAGGVSHHRRRPLGGAPSRGHALPRLL